MKISRLFVLAMAMTLCSTSIEAQTVVNMHLKQNPLFRVSPAEVSLTMTGEALTLGADVVIDGGSGLYTYQWTDAEGAVLGTAATLKVKKPGTYTLKVTDSCQCVQTVVFSIDGTAGIASAEATTVVKAYPNPTYGNLYVDAPATVRQISILSATGKLMLVSKALNPNQPFVNLSQLPAGEYLACIVLADGSKSIHKIIKK